MESIGQGQLASAQDKEMPMMEENCPKMIPFDVLFKARIIKIEKRKI